MTDLAVTVILNDPKGEVVTLGPGDDVPEWAVPQLGDHCWEGGKRPGTSADDGYGSQTKADLQAEVDKRNESREDDAKVVVEGKGNKPDLIAALEADDANQA